MKQRDPFRSSARYPAVSEVKNEQGHDLTRINDTFITKKVRLITN